MAAGIGGLSTLDIMRLIQQPPGTPASFDDRFNQAPTGQGYGVDPSAVAKLRAGLLGQVPVSSIVPGPQQDPTPPSAPSPPAGAPGMPRPAPPPSASAASPADIPAAGTAPVMGGGQATGEPDFGDRFLKGLRDNGDILGALGIGLLSRRGFGPGLAAGLQYADTAATKKAATDLARAEHALKANRLQREQQGENQTKQYLLGIGLDETLASAAMSNPTILSSVLSQMNKDPSVVEIGGNKYSLRPGEKPTPTNLLGPAQSEKDHYDLLDTPEKRAAAGLAPNDPRVARMNGAGDVKYDPPPPAPTVHVLEDENGIKHIRQYDPATRSWIDPAQPPGAPPAPTNPLALKGKVTGDQAKAAGFADRMVASEELLAKNAAQGTGFFQRMGSNVPLVGNYLSSDEFQSFEQAKRDFTNAQLRRESGAAIGKDEFASADRQYFPQPGDSEATIKQKAANRRTAIEAMIREGGQTYLPRKVFDESGALVPFQGAPRAPGGTTSQAVGPARIQSKDEYDRLRSGTSYIAPDGTTRVKP